MENGLSVFIGIESDEKTHTSSIVTGLMEIEGVIEAYELTGSFDILIKAKSGSVTDLNNTVEKIRSTTGVKSTNTYLILEEKK